jgi:hypothetical protein
LNNSKTYSYEEATSNTGKFKKKNGRLIQEHIPGS